MKNDGDSSRPFALGRLYAVVSFAAILGAGVLLAILYRELSIRTIVEFGQQSNVAIATTALGAILPEMAKDLKTEEAETANVAADTRRAEFLRLIDELVRDAPIVRIKIYKKNGIVFYSTRQHEIGADDSTNPRFQGAIQGNVRSELSYRDGFNLVDLSGANDNLIETYVPIWLSGEPRPVGVFEIYTDVNTIIRAMAHSELLIFAGIAVIMIILYGFLLTTVRRAEKVIANQRRTILERNHTLEVLSARMLVAEDAERQRIAWELHEEIAQTLSALKFRVEEFAGAATLLPTSPKAIPGGELVPLIQDAIRDVRALAMDLNPPALDDFGLIAAINWLCREAEQIQERSGITTDITVREEDVPPPLRGVIFRVVQQTLNCLVTTLEIKGTRVTLKNEKGVLLAIEFSAETNGTGDQSEPSAWLDEQQLASIWERAVLSGGSFSATHTDANCFSYQATWIV